MNQKLMVWGIHLDIPLERHSFICIALLDANQVSSDSFDELTISSRLNNISMNHQIDVVEWPGIRPK
jgi:hypothetical protein